jgi:hypothetical protein
MQILRSLNEVLAFTLELAMFFSIGYFGFSKGSTLVSKWVIAIICVLIAITLWAIFASPNSQTRLEFPIRLLFELSMFLLASFLVYKLNYSWQSCCFALLSILSVATAYFLKQ